MDETEREIRELLDNPRSAIMHATLMSFARVLLNSLDEARGHLENSHEGHDQASSLLLMCIEGRDRSDRRLREALMALDEARAEIAGLRSNGNADQVRAHLVAVVDERDLEIARLRALVVEDDQTHVPSFVAGLERNAPPGADATAIAAEIMQQHDLKVMAEPHSMRDWSKSLTEDYARALEQHAAQAREQAIEDVKQIVQLYIDNPTSGPGNNTQEAFDLGVDHEAGAIDNASAIFDAIRAISSQPPQSVWRDIASAPKDGTLILISWIGSELYPVISRWLKSAQVWTHPFNKPVNPPTHWMHLPPPPQSASGE